MGLQWFRLYAEFSTDPKIQSMDETSQRRFIIVLCLRCDGCLEKLTDEEVSCAMRIPLEELKKTKELFMQKGFIDEKWGVLNWEKRQYRSDNSTERTRAYRDKQKQANHGNVTGTSRELKRSITVTPSADTAQPR